MHTSMTTRSDKEALTLKSRYLIKCWFPHRGTSEEKPAYYKGNSNYLFHDLEHEINVEHCYSSLARAQRASGRLGIYTHFSIVEVPPGILVDNHELAMRIVKAGRFADAIRAIDPESKRVMCPYWKYWGKDSDVDFLKPFLDSYMNVHGTALTI